MTITFGSPVNPQTLGTSGATAIVAEIYAGSGGLDSLETVTLTAAYSRNPPLGFPDPNPGMPLASSPTATPKVLSSGTTFTTFACEAAALVGAGVANYG